MVSEDSQCLGRFPVIHRLSDLRDLDDPRHRKVPTEFHQFNDSYELLEVLSLRSSQRVFPEERNDLGAEILEWIDVVPEQILPVVITSSVPEDLPAPKEFDQVFQRLTAGLSLHDVERRTYLPLESHPVTAVDGAAEAALSIHEAHDPSDGLEPFLLVFRTRRIVTGHVATLRSGSDTTGTAGFTGFSSIWPAAHRTVTRTGGSAPCLPRGFLP